MMKDMKWKQIDTTYAGKAFQVEAEEINLHGEVNVQGDLKVNGGSISAPTAVGTTYDNTTSGLTGTNVQDAVDELASVRVKIRNFSTLQEFATWAIANYSTIHILCAVNDSNKVFNCYALSTALIFNTSYIAGGSIVNAAGSNDGTTTTGYFTYGNASTEVIVPDYFDKYTYQVYYI